jgi:hypothetical protein
MIEFTGGANRFATNTMTFEEIDEHAKALFSHKNDAAAWPYIDEGDRSYWRRIAIEKLKRESKTD